ncbi:MAG: hypothetical protein ACR2GH_03430 [Pseudonocardia sp.]
MRARSWVVGAVAAALLVVGCGSSTSGPDAVGGGSATAAATVDPSVMASIEAQQGIPPEPGPDVVAALVADLDAIDPDIVHGKPDKAVNRGRNQCSSVRQFPTSRRSWST